MAAASGSLTRVDLPGDAVGLPRPGFCLRLDFPPLLELPFTVACRTSTDRLGAAGRWMESLGAARIQWGPGLAPRGLSAVFDAVPPFWSRIGPLGPNHVEVAWGGMVSLFVRAHPADVAAFAAAAAGRARIRPALAAPGPSTLSVRQREALAAAVALGFYDTPRLVTLRELARNLGLSLGSASELLRRAEAAVLQGHIDALSLGNGEAGLADGAGPAAGQAPGGQASGWGAMRQRPLASADS